MATLNYTYFFGALYLFFINAVFIGLSTIILVRYLKFKHVAYVDEATRRRMKRYITWVVVLTVVPSIFFGYVIVRETVNEQKINEYLKEEFDFENTQIINKEIHHQWDSTRVEIFLVGEPLSDELLVFLRSRLRKKGLEHVNLTIRQSSASPLIDNSFGSDEIVKQLLVEQQKKSEQIALLEKKVLKYQDKNPHEFNDIAKEIKVLEPSLNSVIISKLPVYRFDGTNRIDSTAVVHLFVGAAVNNDKKRTLEDFIKQRMKVKSVQLVIEKE